MKAESASSKVLKAIQASPSITAAQIAKTAGLSLTHVNRICNELHDISVIHISAWSLRAGGQAPHWSPGFGIDALRIPGVDARRILERRLGHKITHSDQVPGNKPVLDPLTAFALRRAA